ncbi:MAG: FRG domain-containing protein [bacterium]
MKIKEIKGVHTTEAASKWDDFQNIRNEYALDDDRWLYRGQDDYCWEIRSTFERNRESSGKSDSWKYEATVVREFKRRAHLYLRNLPDDRDILEWFSLLRHFGAPCRLVDVTYSFYVAIYFAIRSLGHKSTPAAIWAFDTKWLKNQWNKLFPDETVESHRGGDFRFKEPDDFRKHFLNFNKTKLFVAPANPFRQNERLTAQQGLFLCPGDISKSFMENLIPNPTNSHEKNVIRIPIMSSIKPQAIQELRRMNISSATLFPDLGGFAESLSDWFTLDLPFNDKDLLKALCI